MPSGRSLGGAGSSVTVCDGRGAQPLRFQRVSPAALGLLFCNQRFSFVTTFFSAGPGLCRCRLCVSLKSGSDRFYHFRPIASSRKPVNEISAPFSNLFPPPYAYNACGAYNACNACNASHLLGSLAVMLRNACVTHTNSAVIYLSNHYPHHMPFGHNIYGVSAVSNTLK